MSLATLMLEQLSVARRIVEDSHELAPTWRIETPEGAFLIPTPFDSEKPEQRERAIFLVSRFMAWKLATGFVLTTKTWLAAELTRTSDEALLAVGISAHERLAVLQRIQPGDHLDFGQPRWLAAYHVDDCYLKMLPGRRAEITAEEAVALSQTFSKSGEIPAARLSQKGGGSP
jgi:hypothetical protein